MKAAGRRKAKGLASLTTSHWAEPRCLVGGESKRHPLQGSSLWAASGCRAGGFPGRARVGEGPDLLCSTEPNRTRLAFVRVALTEAHFPKPDGAWPLPVGSHRPL